MSATVERIWLKRSKRGVMDAVDQAEAVRDRGLVGNANQGGRRQVTLLCRESWSQALETLGAEVDPAARRANILISGTSFEGTRGRILRIGRVRIRIRGETRPCERMDEAHEGLRDALDPPWRAGAFGEVLDSATIRVGDMVEWVAEESA